MLNAHSREACSRFIEHLRHDPETTIIQADPEWMRRGFELYRKRLDKDWSLTDCISFVVMTDEGLVEALTGDHHFKQAGFTALLAKVPRVPDTTTLLKTTARCGPARLRESSPLDPSLSRSDSECTRANSRNSRLLAHWNPAPAVRGAVCQRRKNH